MAGSMRKRFVGWGRDKLVASAVSPLRSLMSALQMQTQSEGERWIRDAFEEAFVGLNITDSEGHIRSINKGFADIIGYSAEELKGKTIGSLVADEQGRSVVRDLGSLAKGSVPHYRAERRFRRKDGKCVWVRSSVTKLKSLGEESIVAICEDITEQKNTRERLRHQATHDLLTGLLNRRQFERNLNKAIARASQPGAELALLFVDLDGFKLINDTLGHATGDLLLREVAARLTGCVSKSDFLARVGGDEFTIAIAGFKSREELHARVDRVVHCFSSPFRVNQHQISVGAATGISLYPADGLDARALMQNADLAMHYAKERATSRDQFVTAQMKEAAHKRFQIVSCLRKALESNELSVHFQPEYQLGDNKLVRFEALCRWRNADLGQVPPDQFIPIAERTGMIVPIGLYVLREACRNAVKWQAGKWPVQVAVNVSAIQFARTDFVDSVITVLRETGLNPSLLELEITESSFHRDLDDNVRKMHLLKEAGIRLSVDDFGTGYSSLGCLQNMPIDAVKVDRSFTANLAKSATGVSMVGAIISMAHALALRVVVEGVETAEQLGIVRRLGSDEVQGYLCGRPEDSSAASERVRRETVLNPASSDLATLASALETPEREPAGNAGVVAAEAPR